MTREERSWILYDWANSAYALAIMTAILPTYFKAVAADGVANATPKFAYASAFASLLIALLAPVLGTIADYPGYKKRFLSMFLALGLLATASLGLVGRGQWQACLLIYVLSSVGFAGANVFYDAFLPDVAERRRMDRVSTYGFAVGYVGGPLPFIVCLVLISNAETIGIDRGLATRLSFLIVAIWWLVWSIPLLRNVRQRYHVTPSPHPVRESFSRLRRTFAHIRRHRQAFLFLLAYFFYIDGVHTIIKMAAVYGDDVGIAQDRILLVLLAVQFVAFPFAILFGRLAERFGTKPLLLVGLCIYLCVTGFAPFVRTVTHYWILALLVGSAQGGVQALSRSFYGKLIPKENAAEFFGFYNVLGKFAAVMGPLLLGLMQQVTGNFRAGVPSLALLFVIGGGLLLRVDGRSAEQEEPAEP